MIKDELRERMRKMRRALTAEEISAKSAKISDFLFSLDVIKDAQTVCTFISAFREPDTIGIIKKLLSSGKEVVVPITDTKTNTLSLSYIKNTEELKSGAFGILEPSVIYPASADSLDAVLVPALALDRRGGRIGFGKGYYDRLLENTDAVKIALCYEFQLFERVPVDEHDVPMDIIITEEKIYAV